MQNRGVITTVGERRVLRFSEEQGFQCYGGSKKWDTFLLSGTERGYRIRPRDVREKLGPNSAIMVMLGGKSVWDKEDREWVWNCERCKPERRVVTGPVSTSDMVNFAPFYDRRCGRF